jgi:hypothetical protein
VRAVLAAVVVCLALPASALALDRGPGVYWVTWKQAGRRLGPTLRFMRG